jgi:hypothetical protein
MPRIRKQILEDKSLSLKEKFLKGLPRKATYLRALILGQRSLIGDDLSKGEKEWSGKYRDSRGKLIDEWIRLGGYVRRLPTGKLVLAEPPIPLDARLGSPWFGAGTLSSDVYEHMGELTTALTWNSRDRSPEQQQLLELANLLAKEKLERKAAREAKRAKKEARLAAG